MPRLIALALLLVAPVAASAQTPASPSAAPTVEQLITNRRFDEAKTAIDAMLARNGRDANALYLMGRLVYAEGNSGAAVDWFEKAVDRDDKVSVYHAWLGSALGDEAQRASKLRQPFLARRVRNEFERAVELDPASVPGRQGLVDFYSIAPGIMGGDMNKARVHAAELMKVSPMRGHYALARIAERQKDTVTAEKELRATVAVQPDSTFGYANLAGFYRRHTRWDDAFATWDALIKARPDLAAGHANWGIYAAISGMHYDRGERELKYYLANIPADAAPATISAVHYRLGQIYEKTARKDQARASYNEALKINPKNQDAKKALDALK
jgi:tetratricopeptide (TPR) repeat protein